MTDPSTSDANASGGSELICLAYLSSAISVMETAALEDLVAVSARNNMHRGVTGMLCYYDGSFLQFLEGPRSEVEMTLRIISKDRRHTDLIEMYHLPVAGRVFANWSMALMRADRIGPEQQHLLRDLRGFAWGDEDRSGHQPDLAILLETFRAWMR